MADLFASAHQRIQEREAPLAARMRPRTWDEFVGQEHLLGPGRLLRRLIEQDAVPSMLLWGPPGSGKTTLAHLIARLTKSHFEALSAVSAGVADLRRIVEQAQERRKLYSQRTILFIDEIHRFNKAQQDAILPYVENGTITLIGATTENPSFEVIAPLLSRCRVFTLQPLTDHQVRLIVQRALDDTERGLGALQVSIDDEAWDLLLTTASGDARVALNAVELAATTASAGPDGRRRITLALMEEALQRRALQYDRAGDQHYDTISAFIKAVRGSDPDGAIYWLARMLEAGEDPLFIARRLIILAAEDIGLADPHALCIAVACQQAVHFVGLPEGAIPLAETTIYLATAPKSNSAYKALQKARKDVLRTRQDPVPLHLRNPVTPMMKGLGYGQGYRYAHEYPGHFVVQDYLPPSVQGRRYYEPTEQGAEREAAERLRRWWGDHKGKAQG
ncbi:MAG: replication-associated recombination protein A [Dehalococcoidia bacterium]|nr:replication-associated recombination protein A [Dehalococcoidia bacterium]MDW8120164.1 replication-associated recombination protein A [Chloroflexota bacterium]